MSDEDEYNNEPSESGDSNPTGTDNSEGTGDNDLDELLGRLTNPDQIMSDTSSYQDPVLGGMGGPESPAWLGLRWREIPEELQQEAWVGLRRWVDWLIAEFKITSAIIPSCWFRHSEIVAELHAAMNLEYKTWEEKLPTVNAMWMWLPQLQSMLEYRLRPMVKDLGSCGKGEHREPEVEARDYDEDLWEQTVFTRRSTATIDRPAGDEDPSFGRVRLITDDGELIGESDIFGVGPVRTGQSASEVEIDGESVAGANDFSVTVTATHVPAGGSFVWEEAATPDGPWGVHDDEENTPEPPVPDSH